MSTPKVFISYAHSDKDWARRFAETLGQEGLAVWFDEFNIKAGQPLVEAWRMGLEKVMRWFC